MGRSLFQPNKGWMDKNIPLLLDPPHILPPDTVLTPNAIKCGNCGKVLTSKYYLFFGIPPSPCIIEALLCENIADETNKEESVISDIKWEAKDYDIESKNQWIFSKQNIMSSKIRICSECHGEYEWHPKWHDGHFLSNRIRQVYFSIEEYQRRHTPIEYTMSDYQKYVISLPDRSHIHWVAGPASYGVFVDMECNYNQAMDDINDLLTIALIPDCDKSMLDFDYDTLSQELRSDVIQDKDRIIPNDQELTNWMKKHFNDHNDDSWYKMESCKVFTNPRTFHRGKNVYKTKYSVIVHYIDKDWDEFYV
jgi:hypothetical protein